MLRSTIDLFVNLFGVSLLKLEWNLISFPELCFGREGSLRRGAHSGIHPFAWRAVANAAVRDVAYRYSSR